MRSAHDGLLLYYLFFIEGNVFALGAFDMFDNVVEDAKATLDLFGLPA